MSEPAALDRGRVETPFLRFVRDYAEDRWAVVAFGVASAVLFVAVFAPLISPTNPYDLASLSILDNRQPPAAPACGAG